MTYEDRARAWCTRQTSWSAGAESMRDKIQTIAHMLREARAEGVAVGVERVAEWLEERGQDVTASRVRDAYRDGAFAELP